MPARVALLKPSILGLVLTAIGGAGMVYFAFVFDSSVASESFGSGRIHNLSRGELKTVGLFVSAVLFLFGRIPSVIEFR
jgi:hypothetical protein